jgi:LacI family transcriptional regulator
MATIKDIAREAGVSATTVSNVIHGKTSRVSQQTIAQINEIIKRSGYTPNMSARALVSNRSKVIGMINHLVPRTSGSFVEDPFHSTLIGSIEEVLRDNGYYLMLRTVEDSADLLNFLRNWNIDGMFFIGLFRDAFFDTLSEVDIPVVLIDSYIEHPRMQNIGLEDFNGGYIATRHLIERGHTHIVFASSPIHKDGVVQERLRGYKSALEEAGIPFREDYIFEQEFTVSTDIELGKEIASKKEVTAVFATADILAAGIMAGLRQSGAAIPGDISVVGFDDINLCQLISPPLTTVHQDAAQKGRLAVASMIRRLKGEPIEAPIILPVSLVERESVKKIN